MPDSMRGRALDTIKRHAETTKGARFVTVEGPRKRRLETYETCAFCGMEHPCPDYVAGTANLNDLNNAELISDYAGGDATERSYWRMIPDPLPESASAEGKHAPPDACGSRVAPCGAQHGAPEPDPLGGDHADPPAKRYGGGHTDPEDYWPHAGSDRAS